MSENNNIEGRLETIERRFNNLLYNLYYGEQTPPQPEEINKDKFARLYNLVKFSIPIQSGTLPICIYLNNKYKESAVETLLYPAEAEGYYYPKGEISPVLIGFKDDMTEDYRIDLSRYGYFDFN